MTVVAKYRTRWCLWWIVLSTMLIRTGEEIKEYKDAWTQSRLWWKRFSSNQNDHDHDCWQVFSLNITEINTTASIMLMLSGSVASFKGVTSNGGQTCGMGKRKKRGIKARICQRASWPIYLILGLFSGPTNPKTFFYDFCIHPSPSFYHLHSRKEPSLPASNQKPFSSLRSTPFRGDVAFFARLENTLSRQMLYCRGFFCLTFFVFMVWWSLVVCCLVPPTSTT